MLLEASFKALTIDDVLEALPKQAALRAEKQLASSELHIPIKTSSEDTVSIIEFYLNKERRDISPHIQEAWLEFIRKKNDIYSRNWMGLLSWNELIKDGTP